MNMRINQFGGAGGWPEVSISLHFSPENTGDDPGLPGATGVEEDDPLDIDAAPPPNSNCKHPSRNNAAPGGIEDPMENNFLKQLLQIILLLSMRNQGDQVPPSEDKGESKGGGGNTGSRGRFDAPFDEHRTESNFGGKPSSNKPGGGGGGGGDEGPKNDASPPGKDRSSEVGGNEKTSTGNGGKTTGASGPGSMPEPTGTVTVNQTIVVKAGEVFDGGGKLYKAGSNLGDGSQKEGQKPIFQIEPGGTVKNLQYEGADGIHTMGDATIKDVWARDVGEDAMTMKKPGNVTWSGGGAFNANDKIFQLNAGGSFTLENFTADGFGKAIRTNGGKQIDTDITIRNSDFKNGKEAIVRTDSTAASIALENVTFSNVPNDVLAPNGTEVSGAVKRGSK